jgi:asparagine synthase (glutamine-hydrolysing)
MCGILCCFSPTDDKITSFTTRLESIKHRGPDETNIKIVQSTNLTTFLCGFHRLAITDVLHGTQPFESEDWIHVHNGEFYDVRPTGLNIYEDEDMYKSGRTGSDSYKLKEMTNDNALDFPSTLNGIFAYCSYNKSTETLYVARDRVGVIPLYYVVETETLPTANDEQTYERIWFASEAKALIGLGEIHMFPPNNLMVCSLQKKESSSHFMSVLTEYYEILPPYPTSNYTHGTEFFEDLVNAVTIRLQDEVPWGAALSGGLDSSIIAAILARPTYNESIEVRSFCIGFENSTDLKIAETWGNYLGPHFSMKITVDEALKSVQDVIWALETYDVTTIRAGIMNYLLAEKMKKYGIKVAYSGEGSDELFGGYLYFHHCPDEKAMQKELIRKMEELCYYDCLRCNKAFAAHGIECRVPFLDQRFVNTVMKLDPTHKLSSTHPAFEKRAEKHILRKNFQRHMEKMEVESTQYIEQDDVDAIANRQKDQFSDSVGKEWIQALVEEASSLVTNDELAVAEEKYPFQTPKTKEAYRYRKIFEDLFKCDGKHFVKYDNNTVACSTKIGAEWCKDMKRDPTGNYVKESINN